MIVAVVSDGNRDQMAHKVKNIYYVVPVHYHPLLPFTSSPCRVSSTPFRGHLPEKAHCPPCPQTARLTANQWLGQTGSHSQALFLLFVCSLGDGGEKSSSLELAICPDGQSTRENAGLWREACL